MILKGSQRGGGQDLAKHLLRTDDNEHVRLHELRDFASDDLRGAFKEAEAVSRGTKCRQFLFSLSLSPPEKASVTVEEYEAAINRAEGRLGLDGQPRAVVFHEKEGRRHAHCVWSRIDSLTMTARPLPFFKERLTGLSRDLYREHGWDMPRGLAERGARDPASFTLAEWQQAKRHGVDPRWLKADLQECWKQSDNGKAFGQALAARGLTLARGDRRILYASLFLGVLAVIAAIRGIRFFNLIVSPLHARLFLVRGVFGALLVPSFVWFASWYYGFDVAGWLWPHLAFGGYAMLSTGVFFMGSDGGAGIVEEIVGIEGPPRYREIDAPPAALPSRSEAKDAKDFRFATWDDEEELRGR